MVIVAPSVAVSCTAAIVGATIVAVYRTLVSSGGNGAVWSFWISVGAYVGLAAEGVSGVLQVVQENVAHRVEMNASTRKM